MTSLSKQVKQAAKRLQRLQVKHAKWVSRVGRARQKLEKMTRKIYPLERKMAELEFLAAELRGPDGMLTAQGGGWLRSARVIMNAGSGTFAQQVETPEKLAAILYTHGILAEIYQKTSTKEVRRWVREAVDNQEELVIAVGGDGTVEDVASALIGSRTALGIIPTGTMNNLARALGIPLNIDEACALIGAGITRQIDVGSIRTLEKKRIHFLETAGLGLAIAIPAGQNLKKGAWGKLPDNLRKMFEAGAEPIQIELDQGQKIETTIRLVTVSNAPLMGVNNLIAPDAKMDDGLLDLAIYDGLNEIELAKYFLDNGNNQRVSNPNVHFYRSRRIHITAHHAMPVTADIEELPEQDELDFEVLPRSLSVIAGQGFALTWPVDSLQNVTPLTGSQDLPEREDSIEQADRHRDADQTKQEPSQPESLRDGEMQQGANNE